MLIMLQCLILLACTNIYAQGLKIQGLKIGLFGNVSEYDGDYTNKGNLYSFKYNKPRFGVYLSQNLSPSFDLEQRIQLFTVDYRPQNGTDFTAKFASINFNLRYNFANGYILKKESKINPFLIAGIGGINFSSTKLASADNAINLQTGGGLLYNLNDVVGIELSSMVNWVQNDIWVGYGGTDNFNDIALVHSLGLVFSLQKSVDTDGDGVKDKDDVEPNTPLGVAVDKQGKALDVDGDFIPDYLDKCKTEAGTTKTNGCPDKDNDGIIDAEDKCPAVPGLARFQGCPDSDGDGIDDANDKCPNIKGLDIFKGCPDTDGDGVDDANDKCSDTEKGIKVDLKGCALDTDGDGIIDSKDKCPNVKGDVAFEGCPAPKKVIKEDVKKRLEFAARSILFESSKSTIRPKSYPMLNEVVTILKEYTDYSLRMLGHTDNSGNSESNLILSQARVDEVRQYLISKGIAESRLEAIGFGSQRQITTNDTPAGRTENRRVEMELYLK